MNIIRFFPNDKCTKAFRPARVLAQILCGWNTLRKIPPSSHDMLKPEEWKLAQAMTVRIMQTRAMKFFIRLTVRVEMFFRRVFCQHCWHGDDFSEGKCICCKCGKIENV